MYGSQKETRAKIRVRRRASVMEVIMRLIIFPWSLTKIG